MKGINVRRTTDRSCRSSSPSPGQNQSDRSQLQAQGASVSGTCGSRSPRPRTPEQPILVRNSRIKEGETGGQEHPGVHAIGGRHRTTGRTSASVIFLAQSAVLAWRRRAGSHPLAEAPRHRSSGARPSSTRALSVITHNRPPRTATRLKVVVAPRRLVTISELVVRWTSTTSSVAFDSSAAVTPSRTRSDATTMSPTNAGVPKSDSCSMRTRSTTTPISRLPFLYNTSAACVLTGFGFASKPSGASKAKPSLLMRAAFAGLLIAARRLRPQLSQASSLERETVRVLRHGCEE